MSDKKQFREPPCFISTARHDAHTVDLLNNLFKDSARGGYSDIHIEDTDEGAVIRRRHNGIMSEYSRISRAQSRDIQDKIRKKSSIPPSELQAPRDGRMFLEVDGRVVDIRVNIYPTRTGHSIVCRLLDQNNASRQLEEVEMTPDVRREIEKIMFGPEGMLLVSGPTGSGKTSTLYAALNKLNTPERKIITVEDPVEYRLEGLVQGQVTVEMTFAKALRAMMRQDPDVALVGEIRDSETARTATEMALTGHVVLSTIHANNAAATITRMLDLGVEPFNLGTALKGVLAQRLSQRLCECTMPRPPNEFERTWMEHYDIKDRHSPVYEPNGCGNCKNGLAGRIPVVEMLVVDSDIAKMVNMARPASEIEEACQNQKQFETLAQAAMRLCREGKVPIAEVIRIGGTDRIIQRKDEKAA
ncbi:GspE/PulE family protein [Thiolapillus sp.]|uniref:GspE/PulE family protein n=2 Tax=Thiolapillus sp. TaxID=2017437 RepID=UPI003AF96889